ncbi:5002_t:CDS:2, partial [Scutellospora calospora]
MESKNYIQHTNIPWIPNSHNRLQYESLFEITSEMQEVLDKELHDYLSEILNLLLEEKLSKINNIDVLANSIGSNDHCKKRCFECSEKNIDNRKQVCSKCSARLLKLTKLQQEQSSELEKDVKDYPIIFKPYSIEESSLFTILRISITQKLSPDKGVRIPDIFVPNPLDINPNSIANVKEILLHIEKISGFAKCQGYKTEKQLAYFKKCYDYHKAWDSICNIYCYAIATELIWLYVKNSLNLSAKRYLTWAKEQNDPLYQFKFEQELDAILEEINKILKTLIPPVPQMHHWRIAARNCKKFFQLWKNFFELIGYNDLQINSLRTRPELTIEHQRFRALLKKNRFINLTAPRTIYKSLDNEYELSLHLSNFTNLAKKEESTQKAEVHITKVEIIFKIEALLVQLDDSVQKRYSRIKSKRRDELLILLDE